MTKTSTDFEDLSKQKTFGGQDAQPDSKGEKVLHSKVNKIRNNKPIPNK